MEKEGRREGEVETIDELAPLLGSQGGRFDQEQSKR